jgi:hypothetical protein
MFGVESSGVECGVRSAGGFGGADVLRGTGLGLGLGLGDYPSIHCPPAASHVCDA